jgi:Na+/H+-dicarboxylate symporter
LPDVFLHLIKMIIAPLVFATLVTGIAGMGDSSALGRIGGASDGWFITASLISIGIGLLLINLFQPGVGLQFKAGGDIGTLATSDFTFRHFVLEVFPTSALDAMANNNVLQILVFSLFFGVTLSALRERGEIIVKGLDALAQLMMQMDRLRDALRALRGSSAPWPRSSRCAGSASSSPMRRWMSEFYFGLLILWTVLFGMCALVLKKRALRMVRYIASRVILASRPASSESAPAPTVRAARPVRRAAPHLGLRPAAGLQLQSRRLDDVHELRDDVHRPGLWHPSRHRPADRHAADADW